MCRCAIPADKDISDPEVANPPELDDFWSAGLVERCQRIPGCDGVTSARVPVFLWTMMRCARAFSPLLSGSAANADIMEARNLHLIELVDVAQADQCIVAYGLEHAQQIKRSDNVRFGDDRRTIRLVERL